MTTTYLDLPFLPVPIPVQVPKVRVRRISNRKTRISSRTLTSRALTRGSVPAEPVHAAEPLLEPGVRLLRRVELSCSGCSAPPFSGVFGSGRWRGCVTSVPASTGLVSPAHKGAVRAVPSAGIDDPAPLLGVRYLVRFGGSGFGPTGQVHRRIGVTVGGMPATAGEYAFDQRHIAVDRSAGRALPGRRLPPIASMSSPPRQACLSFTTGRTRPSRRREAWARR